MAFRVLLTDDAENDLAEIYAYLQQNDSPERADQVLDKIEASFGRLSELPHGGAFSGELLALGLRDYREVFFKPYRITYRVIDDNVYVLLIADGRRDMQTLLQRRLIATP